MFFNANAVDLIHIRPLFQFDTEADPYSLADRRHAEQIAYVYDPKAADLQMFDRQFRSFAVEVFPDLFYLHYVVGDQTVAGGIAWSFGELPTVLVLIVVLVSWAGSDERRARALDRAAERDGDAELTAYNARLRQLAERG